MKSGTILAILIVSGLHLNGQTQLITNGNFSGGNNGWTLGSQYWWISSAFSCNNTNSSPAYAYTGNSDGSYANNMFGSMYQQVTIPSFAVSATLSYKISINTYETTTTTVADVFEAQFRSTSMALLHTFNQLSNLNGGSLPGCQTYQTYSFSVPSTYFGQTIRLNFQTASGPTNATVFRLDDVSLTYTCNTPNQINSLSSTTVSSSQINLSWTPSSGASNYDIFMRQGTCGTVGTFYTNTTSTSNVPITGLNSNTQYSFYVTAKNNCGTSAYSNCTSSTTLSGGGSPIINLSGNLAFGNVSVGSTSQRALTISNTGNAALNVSSINYPSGFSGNWNSGSIVAGSSQNVTVTFAPTAATSYSGTITVNSNASSGTNTIACSGTGTTTASPSISLSGNLAFGNVAVGSTSQRTLTINNTGNAALNVSSINYPSGFSGNWNSGSIAAGSSQNVTVTFAPTAATSYSGTITVNSNASSGTNTIACSGTGISTTPSTITISNVIRNNSTFPNPKILWTGTTNQTSQIIKVCADGSTATKISFTNNTGTPSANIKFWVASDPFGSNSDLSGYFINYTVNGNIVTAEFAHPKYLPSNYRPSKNDQIRIVDFNNPNQTIFSIPLEILRAPLLMVHGLWGAFSTFETVDNHLENNSYYLPLLTLRANYESSNDVYLYDNRFVVPSNINTLFTRARNNNISAGKVDVIAHSMGGLVTRYYLQSTAYSQKKDLHKLITVNTPHSGSPIANLLTNTNSVTADAARIVAEPLANQIFNGSIYNGAIADLSINSNALSYLNSATLNNGTVPSHVIITTSQVINDNFWHLVFAAAAPTLSMSVNGFVDYLFYSQQNDLVVSTSSQSGGVPSFARSTYPNIFHNGSYNNSFVLNELITALNINSSNTNYFTQNGFSPVANNTHFRVATPEPSTFNRLLNTVKINSPTTNENYNPGSVLPINVTTSNGVNRVLIEGINLSNNSNYIDSTLTNGIFNYQIPANAFGKMRFIAIGYKDNNLIDYDTVTININQTTPLQNIAFLSDTLIVQVNNTAAIPLRAYFANGNTYDLNSLTGVQLQLTDTNYVIISNGDVLRGKAVGSTILRATYLTKNSQIPVLVIPADTTIKNGLTNNDTLVTTPVTPLDPTNSVKIYPNPNRGDFTAFMVLKEDEVVTIEIFNQIGQRLFSTQRKSINRIVRAYLSIGSNIQNGVYYIKVTGKNESQTGKFLILPDK
ncbi:choice-of-anchor D domain-containing protein [Lacibacter sp.]|uniref:choice-of-anchor D domain-containing protein n=1 Tax=Lacibacter sp. TaxID=1915409 RepID=UPI002B4B5880|nr:choice-of-anchor D domain-containing protein [Lacibacter sp.]HLP36757.1 choice-of-anchor D domain-containing protein [Lacibacter sp.]